MLLLIVESVVCYITKKLYLEQKSIQNFVDFFFLLLSSLFTINHLTLWSPSSRNIGLNKLREKAEFAELIF